MRIPAFRAWFASAVQQGLGAARRAGLAVSRGLRRATEEIDVSVGVGDDESRFGQSGSRAWVEDLVEDARKRLLELFEHSLFERRFPRFERFVKRVLGRPVRLAQQAPRLEPPRRTAPSRPLGAQRATPGAAEEARLRQQVRLGLTQARTKERAGLRARVEPRRQDEDAGEPSGPGPHS